VVEHSIGNGEVDSSILSGSTIPAQKNPGFERINRVSGRPQMELVGQPKVLPAACHPAKN
jgi:hypothetical protein